MPSAKQLEDQSRQMLFGNKEVSYLGFTLTPGGIKPGKSKVKAIKDVKPPTDVKTIQSFVDLCNFFPHPHRKLCNHSSTTFPTHKKGFRLQRWSSPKGSKGRFLHSQKFLTVQTSDGISKSRPSVRPDYWCHHWHGQHSGRPRNDPHKVGSICSLLCHLICLQTTQRTQKELRTVSSRISSCHLGYGRFEWIPQKKENHTLHRPGMIESVSKFSLNGTNSNRAIWKPLLMRFPRLGKKGKILMNII